MTYGKASKKGFVYTLFVISFLVSIVMFISMQKDIQPRSEIAEKIRADEVISFSHAIAGDIGRSSYISGKRALLALTNNITEGNGSFSENADNAAMELLINGTLGGFPAEIMENSTIHSWAEILKIIGHERRMDVNLSIDDIRIIQASYFEIALISNVSTYIYDPLTKIMYNKTMHIVQNVPVEQIEDPYIAIKSLGSASNTFKSCAFRTGSSHGGSWAYGKINASTQSDFAGGSPDQILVTDTIVGKSNYGNFKAVITETGSDIPLVPTYIVGVPAGTLSASKNGSYAVVSNNTFWLTNDTSCYFESPEGPSFFDRLEGRDSLSLKYSLPDKITGLGTFILTFDKGRCLDYKYYYDGTCL